MNPSTTKTFIERFWAEKVLQTLKDYIRIPNISPAYDAQWEEKGHMTRVAELLRDWVEEQRVDNVRVELLTPAGRTPLLLVDVQGTAPGNVLIYGHMDKQPPLSGWREGLSAFEPVIEGDRLYGRGSADDGYAIFSAIGAIKSLQEQGAPYPRCLILIEGSEESGSIDLPAYVDELEDTIGKPELVICLDSGCGTYDRLWLTTSLRGCVIGNLRVDILTEGAHSGSASGVIPSSFRIIRTLLSRIEDEATGDVLLDELYSPVTELEQEAVAQVAGLLKDELTQSFALVDDARCVSDDPAECFLNRTLKPVLSVTGADGLPTLLDAGNVLRPFTAVKLSMRLPPRVDAQVAATAMKEALEANPPYGARVCFEIEEPMGGWSAPPLADWLSTAVQDASSEHFGEAVCSMGEGGSIPFMGMLGEKFPEAQFLITGVLGPESNAHGPNEFLDIPTFKRVTACVAHVLTEAAKEATK